MSSIKSSFKWSFIIQASFQIIGFLVSIILARILSPSDFGIIGILTIFINLSKNITDGGLASSLIRTKAPSERDFSTVFYFNLVCSISLYAILFIAAPFIANFFKVPLIENSTLEYEWIDAITICNECEKTYDTIQYGRECPYCKSEHTVLLQGNECLIKEIEAE